MFLDLPPLRFKLFAALLVLCAVIAYLPAIGAGFIWDDDILLTANPQLHSFSGLGEIWSGKNSHDYTPLTLTTFWLEKRVWGDTPVGYHVVNILLHAIAGVLLWRVLEGLRLPGAWIAALLFVIHPVNVASVAWIAERKNTLSGALFFGSILSFLVAQKRDHTAVYLLSIGLFLLAGLSKGAVVTMPLVLCGCILWVNKKITRRDLLRLIPFLLISLAIALLTIRYQARAPDFGLIRTDLPFRIARAGAVIWIYLGGIFFPIGLSPMSPPWQPNLRTPLAYLPGMLVIAAVGLLYCKRKSWGKPLLFVSGYYLWMLLPVLGFIRLALQQETPCADWWQYLAAPGIFAGIAGGLCVVSNAVKENSRHGLHALLYVVLALLFLQTWRRGATYHSMETYCRAGLAENPHAWSLQNNLGVVLARQGKFEEAIAHYRQSLDDNPQFMEAHNNLGNALAGMGKWQEADGEFHVALRLRPANPEVLGNLADSYFRQGKSHEALAADAEAIKVDRYNPQRYIQFGRMLAANNQFEQAIVCFRDALVLAPGNIGAQVDLTQALLAAGHGKEASLLCEQALQAARPSGSQQLIQTITSLCQQCAAPAQK
ncbi:MAG: tetratricopeptide repeat protein [Verrucomicrobiota bacterium]|nr:tetratricopeptide repeat protein [Verrucomicrobiota bacterium]